MASRSPPQRNANNPSMDAPSGEITIADRTVPEATNANAGEARRAELRSLTVEHVRTNSLEARAPHPCSTCGFDVGSSPFCPQDGTLVAGPFSFGERYTIEQLLGSGGAALVFAGTHRALRKPVAIKIPKPHLATNPNQVERFLREARLASRLKHENIINVVDFGTNEAFGLPMLVMERVRGGTVASLMKTQRLIPWKRVSSILVQVARALVVAHDAGIVHRDLTPRNIMLEHASGREDQVRLCDFGLSKFLDDDARLTMTGQVLGTPAYMAPEQIEGDQPLDAKLDVYALGVIAYEMLTGRLPYRGTTSAAIIASKLRDTPRPPQTAAPGADIPDELNSLVVRCLSTEPASRPSARDVEATLAHALASKVSTQRGKTLDIIGLQVGSYEIKERVGSGGAGAVYRAVHPMLGTEVAIKVLLPEAAVHGELVDRFIQEARASSALASPHIVRYHDFGQLEDGRPYAVMEFCHGETLTNRLARLGPLPIAAAAKICGQVASALSEAHQAGIVHRDLKPDNILLATDAMNGPEIVKVLDFGIAKVRSPITKARTTQLGHFMGTPAYAAPEQLIGGNVGPPADIYALGVTLFELVTGRLPFDGQVEEIARAKLSTDAPRTTEFRSGVPHSIDNDIAVMLAREPAQRFQSMELVFERCAVWKIDAEKTDAESAEEALPTLVSTPARDARGAEHKSTPRNAHASIEHDPTLQGSPSAPDDAADTHLDSELALRMDEATPRVQLVSSRASQPRSRTVAMVITTLIAIVCIVVALVVRSMGADAPQTPPDTARSVATPSREPIPAPVPAAATPVPPIAVAPAYPPVEEPERDPVERAPVAPRQVRRSRQTRDKQVRSAEPRRRDVRIADPFESP